MRLTNEQSCALLEKHGLLRHRGPATNATSYLGRCGSRAKANPACGARGNAVMGKTRTRREPLWLANCCFNRCNNVTLR